MGFIKITLQFLKTLCLCLIFYSRLSQGFIQDFSKRGGNHLTPPTYQETVPITNALTARIRLWKILGVFEQLHMFLLQQLSLCCCLCFKPPYYNTCADLKGGGGIFERGGGGGGGGEVPPLPPPCMNPCSVVACQCQLHCLSILGVVHPSQLVQSCAWRPGG